MKMNVTVTLVMLVAMAMTVPCFAATRDLVFEEEDLDAGKAPAEKAVDAVEDGPPSDMQKVVKVNATVELTRDGETKDVLPSATFKSGDKVRIKYVSNVDAYAYWLAEGSSGEVYMLFPNAKTGSENLVSANEESTIPTTGNFKFDDQPGTETLTLILSPEPNPDLDEFAKTNAVKGGSPKLSTKEVEEVKEIAEDQEEKSTTRDLVFEEEEDEESGVATKTQKTSDIKQPFVMVWELKHE